MYGTTAQIASAAGVATIGAAFLRWKPPFRRGWRYLRRWRYLSHRLWPVPRFCRGCGARLAEVN
jgi:hypothetical protein